MSSTLDHLETYTLVCEFHPITKIEIGSSLLDNGLISPTAAARATCAYNVLRSIGSGGGSKLPQRRPWLQPLCHVALLGSDLAVDLQACVGQ